MKKIIFRTFGGKESGYGHIFRCISLAKAIIKESVDFEINFLVNDELENIVIENGFKYHLINNFNFDYKLMKEISPDLIIFDSYKANDSYLENIKKISKLILFDDNNDIYDSKIPDMIINGNIYAGDLNYNKSDRTTFLLGTQYLIMRENYWYDSSNEFIEKKGILVTTGGSDSFNISPKILKALKKTDYIKKVIVGPGYSKETIDEIYNIKDNKTQIIMNPNGLKNYIKSSKYVITAAGSTVYEVLSQKTFPIIFSLAENQNIAYEYFRKKGIQSIGVFPNINYNGLINSLKKSNKTEEDVYNMIDGKGALRVAREIMKIL